MASILLIDDDSKLRAMVGEYLHEHGHQVLDADNTLTGDQLIVNNQISLLILDINLPGEDGLSFLKRLRKRQCNFPILILSGRGHELDRIKGLDLGADDYLVKPFSPRELLSRVAAMMRRTSMFNPLPVDIHFGNFHYDPAKIALYEGDIEISLSSGERALIKVLSEHPNQTLSRHELLSLLGDEFGENFERSIDVRVNRLRVRIRDNAEAPRYIRTIRGQGYCFTPDPSIKS